MRTWNELDKTERERAVNKALEMLLNVVVEGAIRFNDKENGNTLQADIDKAIALANGMRTPWFAGEYVIDAVGPILRSMAQCDAEDAYYPDCGEHVIRL